MKKIININLSGRVIPIEDSAYESLQRYIESLRRYFANEEGRDEIINDIESRVAELMNDKIKKTRTPKSADSITNGALKLPLKERCQLVETLKESIKAEVETLAEAAKQAAQTANGMG